MFDPKMFDPNANPDYRQWLNQPPPFWEDLGQRQAQRLRQVITPLGSMQLEHVITSVVTRIPLEGERAVAYAKGMREGYFPKKDGDEQPKAEQDPKRE
jgi:hypothetical protein